jgi:hypothetical protein
MNAMIGRNWILTINYKDSPPMSDENLSLYLKGLDKIQFYAFQLERSISDTLHHQIYLIFRTNQRFSKLKKLFPKAHIEYRRGTHEEALFYVTKEATRHQPPMTWGQEPKKGVRTDLQEITEMMNAGATVNEIRSKFPTQYLMYHRHIDQYLNTVKRELYKTKFRKLEVVYVYDIPGAGKTRTIMEHFGYLNVYRINDYEHPFDNYQYEDVLLIDEFRGQFSIEMMLNLLDGYPLELPARYSNRYAAYKKVYIVSNMPFDSQYPRIKLNAPESFQALKRRIQKELNVEEFKIWFEKGF